MKKIAIFIAMIILCSFMVLAQQGIHEPGTGIENPEIKEAGQGTGQGLTDNGTADQGEAQQIQQQEQTQLMDGAGNQTKAKNTNELKQIIQTKQQLMNQEIQGFDQDKQQVYQNQNQVRLAVHSFLAMEELVGGIGPQVSAIAKNFNNSIQKTLNAEENIEKKSGFARFFTGGDEESAEEIEQEITQNKLKIQELKQLREDCDCDEEVKALMQEQIQNMENEQIRLQTLAQSEKESKGLFGWIWK